MLVIVSQQTLSPDTQCGTSRRRQDRSSRLRRPRCARFISQFSDRPMLSDDQRPRKGKRPFKAASLQIAKQPEGRGLPEGQQGCQESHRLRTRFTGEPTGLVHADECTRCTGRVHHVHWRVHHVHYEGAPGALTYGTRRSEPEERTRSPPTPRGGERAGKHFRNLDIEIEGDGS
jgi:hypothetical protein